MQQRQHERNPEQEKIEKRRQVMIFFDFRLFLVLGIGLVL